jgi:hypothetical protein
MTLTLFIWLVGLTKELMDLIGTHEVLRRRIPLGLALAWGYDLEAVPR